MKTLTQITKKRGEITTVEMLLMDSQSQAYLVYFEVVDKKDYNYQMIPISEDSMFAWLHDRKYWLYQHPEEYKKLMEKLKKIYIKRDF